MANKIEQITKGDDNIYPVTKSEAVYMDDGNTLQNFADSTLTAEESIPVEPLTPTVSTDMIVDGAVTPAKMDFSSSITDGSIQIGDTLIQYGTFRASGIPTAAYGEKSFTLNFPIQYTSSPVMTVAMSDIGGYCGEYIIVNDPVTTSTAQIVCGHTGAALSDISTIRWIAIGKKTN